MRPQRISLKTILVVTLLAALALAAGCSTVEQKDFLNLQAVVAQNQRNLQDMNQRLGKLEERVSASQRPQAELGADMTSLRQDLMRLNGRLEENEHRLNSMAGEDVTAQVKEQQAKTDQRLAKVEKYLGLADGKTPSAPAPAAGKAAEPAKPQAKETDKDLYNLAMRLYKQNSYTAARDRWESILKQYPKSSLVDDCHFWIGQCFYAEKKYEEAILSYNTVIKRYPKSSKVPPSLYKQGLAFLKLGDKRTAKIVFTKLVNSYPKHSLAKEAQNHLKRLK